MQKWHGDIELDGKWQYAESFSLHMYSWLLQTFLTVTSSIFCKPTCLSCPSSPYTKRVGYKISICVLILLFQNLFSCIEANYRISFPPFFFCGGGSRQQERNQCICRLTSVTPEDGKNYMTDSSKNWKSLFTCKSYLSWILHISVLTLLEKQNKAQKHSEHLNSFIKDVQT